MMGEAQTAWGDYIILPQICVSCPPFGIKTMKFKAIVYMSLIPAVGLDLSGKYSWAMQYRHWLIAMCSNPVGFLPHHVTLRQTLLSESQSPSSTKLSNVVSACQSWVLIKIIRVLVKIQVLGSKTQFLLGCIKCLGSKLEL